MATEYVKILVRRGLREQLTSDILDTGEFGFTTDTNQLFIGIDEAINEIQFDPFINAHAVIQSWLDSDDCPFEGLTVDEDLVIRNIPEIYEQDGTPMSAIQAILDAMHFFTQEIELVGDFNVDDGDVIYQRKFIFSDDEADIDNLVAEKTYKILSVAPNSQDFFNDAAGTIEREYSKHDTFTVREDYSIVPNVHNHEGSHVVEIVDISEVTHGTVSYVEPYDADNDKKKIIVRVREGRPEFIQDNPYVDNYYHFNGDDNGNLDSDFGLFRWVEPGEWVKQDITIIDEANFPDSIEQVTYNEIVIDKPAVGLMSNVDVNDHVVVTKSSKVTYWVRDAELADWKLIGSEKYESGLAEMNINTAVHDIPDNVVQAYEDKLGGYWKVIMTENKGTAEETVRELEDTEFWFWYYPDAIPGYNGEPLVAGQIYIPGTEGDAIEDEIEIRYYYEDNFQFSNKPPSEYTNQDDTFTPPELRSNQDDLVFGDYYVYTDKDIFGGTNLNIFKWVYKDYKYQHDTVPVYYSDEEAIGNATDGVLLYALPYTFEGEYAESSVAILELRQRDYNTSNFWYPYDFSAILAYHFTLNPIPNVAEPDITYAHQISGKSEFAVGYLGRARRNVEVITENSFNQLYADQHLTAQDAATGLRPSLFRKIFTDEDGVFLKFHKMISTTFFVDYSLKQVTPTKTFLRVGTLKIINGYPHDMPEIKLTDENTEIWHDNLASGNEDTLEDFDEFSNIVFETAVGEDQYGDETNDMLIIYRQEPGTTTEISYTLKRWTM